MGREEIRDIAEREFSNINKKLDLNETVYHPYIDEFATSMEMAGMSISLLQLDNELKELLKKLADTPFFVQAELK